MVISAFELNILCTIFHYRFFNFRYAKNTNRAQAERPAAKLTFYDHDMIDFVATGKRVHAYCTFDARSVYPDRPGSLLAGLYLGSYRCRNEIRHSTPYKQGLCVR